MKWAHCARKTLQTKRAPFQAARWKETDCKKADNHLPRSWPGLNFRRTVLSPSCHLYFKSLNVSLNYIYDTETRRWSFSLIPDHEAWGFGVHIHGNPYTPS